MKSLRRIAIVAIAGLGVLALAQAQDYTNKFNEAKPELDRLMHSMQYGEAVGKIRAILPQEIPDFPQDPANPQVALTGYSELGSLVDFHECLYKALLASGDTEGAIACIKKAEEIAKKNAAYTEAGLTPTIESWLAAIEKGKGNLKELATVKEEILAENANIESKVKPGAKKSRADNRKLADNEKELAFVEEKIAEIEGQMKTALDVMGELNRCVDTAKTDSVKFAQDTRDMESDLAAEKDDIDSKFKGDRVKYVAAALPKANDLADPRDKVKFLGRLSVLDPNNAAVRRQLDAALGKQ